MANSFRCSPWPIELRSTAEVASISTLYRAVLVAGGCTAAATPRASGRRRRAAGRRDIGASGVGAGGRPAGRSGHARPPAPRTGREGGGRWQDRKPSSVPPPERGDGHLSGTVVADRLEQPTRGSSARGRGVVRAAPCRCLALLRPGVAVPPTVAGGAVGSYPTVSPLPVPRGAIGGVLSVALSVALRRPGVTWRSALWSSDFPRPPEGPRPSRPAGGKYNGGAGPRDLRPPTSDLRPSSPRLPHHLSLPPWGQLASPFTRASPRTASSR